MESKKRTKAAIRNGQEEMKVVINSVQSEIEETIKHRPEDVLVLVDQWTQTLH